MQPLQFHRVLRFAWLGSLALPLAFATVASAADAPWRSLPLIQDGKVHPLWCHVGWGGFTAEDGVLKTECDPRGLGLIVYQPEQFGNCQLRVVFRTEKPKSNAGVFVRVPPDILQETNRPGAAFDRSSGKISPASRKAMELSAERDEGTWFAVNRGYEIQIMDDNDPFHRTGAVYSLAPSTAVPPKPGFDGWRTMIITLDGPRILVEVDGRRTTQFDSSQTNLPPRKGWFEPRHEPLRPQIGCIGLQNHDPGDVVWFGEISVRPLPQ